VDRNRLKRITRETFRCFKPTGWDIVVLVHKNAYTEENKRLRSSLQQLLAQLD
jgi:ribonuclease P protein component